jgi:hypothetical protein
MANQVMNFARGKYGYYTSDALGLAGANSRIVIVVLQAAEADDTLNNYDDLGALLAASGNTEATASGYARKSHAAAGITYSVDDTANTAKAVIDADDTWTAVTGSAFVKLLVCWDGDNTAGTDANIVVLSHHDFAVTPNGGDITADYNQSTGVWASA